MRDHIGPLEFRFSLIEFNQSVLDKLKVDVMFFPGGRSINQFWEGGRQIDFSFRFGGADLKPSILIQFYQGYAESMLDYNQYVEEVRIGFLL